MTLKKVSPGDELQISAPAYNAFVDAAEQERKRANSSEVIQQEQVISSTLLKTSNNTGLALSRFHVVGLEEPVWTPADRLLSFKNDTGMKVVVPADRHANKFAICFDLIRIGGVGYCVYSGVTNVVIEIVDQTHKWAQRIPGDHTKLRSTDQCTSCYILWKNGTSGDQWCRVRLSNPCEDAGSSSSSSPSSSSSSSSSSVCEPCCIEYTFTEMQFGTPFYDPAACSGESDLTNYLYLPGRPGGQTALGEYVFEGPTGTDNVVTIEGSGATHTGRLLTLVDVSGANSTYFDANGKPFFPDSGWAFINDTNTGIRRCGTDANTLADVTGGTYRGIVDANGNYGLGTVVPTVNYRADVVAGAGAINALRAEASSGALEATLAVAGRGASGYFSNTLGTATYATLASTTAGGLFQRQYRAVELVNPSAAIVASDTFGGIRAAYIMSAASVAQFSDGTNTFIIGDGTYSARANSHMAVQGGSEFRYFDVGNSNYIAFEAPALVADTTYVWPAADGSGFDVLTTNGAGALTWDTIDYTFVSARDGATDVTAAELEELTDGSVTVLHSHAAGASTDTLDDVCDRGSSTDQVITSTGGFVGGADGSGVDVTFYSATLGDSFFWDASEAKLVITGTNAQNALEVPDGNVSITDTLTATNIGAFNLTGKLTAGATEIEGSNFDIDGGDISAGTVSGGLTWNAGQNLLGNQWTNFNFDSGQITGGTLAAPVVNSSVSGTAFLDEDDMASDSATKFCSQQSIKAYVDTTAAAASHLHDGDTLQHDGVNSDGGAFSFTTTGIVTYNHGLKIDLTDNTEIGLHIEGAASQSGTLFKMTDSSGNTFFDSGDGLASSTVVWNEQGADIDFRWEASGGVAHMLSIDGGNKRVGVGASPTHFFTVDGGNLAAPLVKFVNDNTTYGTQFILDSTGGSGGDWRIVSQGSTNRWSVYSLTFGAHILWINSDGSTVLDTGSLAGVSFEIVNDNTTYGSQFALDSSGGSGGEWRFVSRGNSDAFAIYGVTGAAYRFWIESAGDTGINTTNPGQIFDINSGSGNMIADGYDNHSRRILKEAITRLDVEGFITRFKQLSLYKYRRKPFVARDELKEAVIAEFGKPRWDALYPGPDDYAREALWNCPDPEIKTFCDQYAEKLRKERRKDPAWKKREEIGLIADDPEIERTSPEVLSWQTDKVTGDAKVSGINIASYVGFLHGVIRELVGRVEALEARI